MDLDEIEGLSYTHLINNLPKIVSAFSVSTRISKGKLHRWNRMHNRKIIRTVSLPDEIEKYMIDELVPKPGWFWTSSSKNRSNARFFY
jgi:hypothetical protein